jgi:hypothetical protein
MHIRRDRAMADKQPMQADGSGTRGAGGDRTDGVEASHPRAAGGESGGGAYPNPHTGKADKDKDDPGAFLGTGGQSGVDYHGPGQLGDEDVPDKSGGQGG